MTLFVWSDMFSVGFSEIDAQHQRLFSIGNNFHGEHSRGATRGTMEKIFGELIEYTRYHFDDEERILKKCGYPELPKHHLNHEKLVRLVQGYQKQLQAGTPGVEGQCMEFIKMWLNAHILGSDKQYSPYLIGSEQPAAAVS